jgi:transcriptional regulator with XRE-family HTH domain
MELGKRLCELRNAKGLTEDAIGKRSGLANTYISRLENDHITPTLAVLDRPPKALDVELYNFSFLGRQSRKLLNFRNTFLPGLKSGPSSDSSVRWPLRMDRC